jgi:hypothetical protein
MIEGLPDRQDESDIFAARVAAASTAAGFSAAAIAAWFVNYAVFSRSCG